MNSVAPDIKKDDKLDKNHSVSAKRRGVLSVVTFFRTWGRRALGFVLRGLAELTAVSLGLGILWLSLLTNVMVKGEADVSFLKRNFTLWFAQAYDGQDADIETFKVQWHPERSAIGVLAENIIVTDDNDASLLTVTSIYTESPVSSFLKSGFEAKRLDLKGGQFTVHRDESGAIFGAVGGPDAFGRLGPIIPIAGSPGDGGGNLIDSVSLLGTDVFFRDKTSGLSLDLQNMEFETSISDETILANGTAVLASSEDTLIEPSLRQTSQSLPKLLLSVKRERVGNKALDVSINVDDLNLADLKFKDGVFNVLKQIDTPLNFTSTWRDVSAQQRSVNFALETADQEHIWRLPTLGDVENISISGHWDIAADKIKVSGFTLDCDHVDFQGDFTLSNAFPKNGQSSTPVEFDVNIKEFTWDADKVLPKALRVNDGIIKGRYLASQGQVDLEQMSLPIDDYKLVASGELKNVLGRANKAPVSMKLSGEFDGSLSETDFLSLWPENFILGGRNWVKSSIVAATLFDMKFDMDIPDFSQIEGGLADDAIKFDFKIRDGLVQYIRTMTPLDQASGFGQLRANGLDLTLTGGHVGEMIIETGQVSIPQFFPYGSDFTIEFEGYGPVNDMVELIDQEPFEYAKIYNLDPQDFSGQGRAKMKITRPLRERFDPSLIRYDVEVQGSNISAPFGLGGFTLTDGELFLSANKEGMTIKGPAKVGPFEAQINWREAFDFGATPTLLNVSSSIDNSVLDKLGLSLREYFGGEVPFTLEASGEGVAFDTATMRVDLSGSELVIGDFWSKNKDVAGDLIMSITRNAEGQVIVDDLSVSAPGLSLEGALKLDEDLRLLEASLKSIRVDNLIDARVTINRKAPEHPLQTTLSGDFLNLDGFIDATVWQPDDSEKVPMILTANMNVLQLAPDYQINKASLLYNHTGRAIDQFRFSGGSESGPVILDLQTLNEGPYSSRLTFDIANASEATDAFFALDSLRGGRLFGEAVRPRGEDNLLWSGTVNVDNFTLTQAPVLAQILSLASLNGLGNVLSGSGLKFETVELPFTWQDGVLGLEGARAAGPALGLTGDGTIDISNKLVDLDGTLIPAYAANSFLGSIPILGDIFGGDSDNATLGLTYGVRGAFDKAQVNVNPLSALTPGVLRKIFKPAREKKRITIPSDAEGESSSEVSQSESDKVDEPR